MIKDGVCEGSKRGESLSGTLTIPEGTRKIGQGAFYHYENVTALELPRSLRIVGKGAFCYCIGLVGALALPDGVIDIQKEAFCDCWGITTLRLPRSLTAVGEKAFQGCSGLSGTLTIPGARALSVCTDRVVCRACHAWRRPSRPPTDRRKGSLREREVLQHQLGRLGPPPSVLCSYLLVCYVPSLPSSKEASQRLVLTLSGDAPGWPHSSFRTPSGPSAPVVLAIAPALQPSSSCPTFPACWLCWCATSSAARRVATAERRAAPSVTSAAARSKSTALVATAAATAAGGASPRARE